jgi:hypothetical protein
MATLTISLPEAVLARLKSRAEAEGTTPEAVVVADLEKSYPPKPGELLRKICGAYTYGERDVASRVDELIGDGLIGELREFRLGNPEDHWGFDF